MRDIHKQSIALACGLMAGILGLRAQHAHFARSGTVEYEKRVNMFARINERMRWIKAGDVVTEKILDEYKKGQPQFKSYAYRLQFTPSNSSYKPSGERSTTWTEVENDPAIDHQNTVYVDLKQGKRVSNKNPYGKRYTVADTLRAIKWKLTDERRVIAGYDCRRANGITMDSVYIVAFYTDRIPVLGGPESFHGLPGLILGLVLPHEHVSWFATSVKGHPVEEKTVLPPESTSTMEKSEFTETIDRLLENRGNYKFTLKKMLLL